MRKTNNLPWMGRTVVVAIMALVGLGAFAGSAQAQGTTFFDFDDCRRLVELLRLRRDAGDSRRWRGRHDRHHEGERKQSLQDV